MSENEKLLSKFQEMKKLRDSYTSNFGVFGEERLEHEDRTTENIDKIQDKI